MLNIIASKWVEAALQQRPPFLLVASSSNNLAITNILDQFNQIGYQDDNIGIPIRWLPEINSYGLYLASTSKATAAGRKYLCRERGKEKGSVNDFYNFNYLEQAKIYYLQQFNDFYHKTECNLKNCQDFIHAQMLKIQAIIQETINFALKHRNDNKKFVERYGSIETIEKLIISQYDEKKLSEANKKSLQDLQGKWLAYKVHDLKWWILFSWIPTVKNLLKDKVNLYLQNHFELFNESINDLSEVDIIINKRIKECTLELNQIDKKLADLLAAKQLYHQLAQDKEALEQRIDLTFDTNRLDDFSDKENLLNKLDTTLRHQLFILATHYWEAGWLLTSEEVNKLTYDKEGRRRYWEIQAMLTPCFITTLHSGPTFFQYKAPSQEFEKLDDFIDLLIIDEAGQVMPAVAGAMISTAKKVLLVGDTKQIKPIFSLPEGIDFANAKKFKLCKDVFEYEHLKYQGILCAGDANTLHSYGNLVIVGQRKAKYHLQGQKLAGMLLKEHRRCAKEIISYCNELCYDNQLIPMTEERPCPYPRIGYAHIKGKMDKRGGSHFNKYEAKVIAAWIAKNEAKILEICQADHLNDCVGIVTPFAAQGNTIRFELKRYGLDIEKVGTVHSLQGAENDIIIFSSVYVADDHQNTYFFDKSPNMLNVAVSRAKRSFLVFGDMDIFDPLKGNYPSTLLAKYLFANEDNEIKDIIQPKFTIANSIKNQQINTLEGHREVLRNSFSQAYKELNIVSPYLRVNAIKNDNIEELIEQYSAKIKIYIYADPLLNIANNQFYEAVQLLEKAGATVFLVNNVHSKIIAVDDWIFILGSFNWLSASRTDERYMREETSFVITGEKADDHIKGALQPIRSKVKDWEKVKSKVNDVVYA